MQQTEIIFSVQEAAEGGYEARARDIFTQAGTMEVLREWFGTPYAATLTASHLPR